MAFPGSAFCSSSFRIKLLKGKSVQLYCGLPIHARNPTISLKNSVKLPTMAKFWEPNKIKVHMKYAREKFWEVIPDSAKTFPWKKAEATALQQLLLLGQQALKLSLIALFVFSSVSDIVYSISRNKELMIPFGLFVGCIVADFLKDTSQELFRDSEERASRLHLFGVACFFVLVKILSTYFTLGEQVFLLHTANGGLMQVLWLSKSSPEQERDNRSNSRLEDASTARNL